MKTTYGIGIALGLAFACVATAGENWAQWRGPAFNGSTVARGLPGELSRESVLWSAPVPGPSGATPIIWNDHVFTHSPDESGNLALIAMDRRSGKELWRQEVGIGVRGGSGGAVKKLYDALPVRRDTQLIER
jgi:outer membrane protein assembly factor BamB